VRDRSKSGCYSPIRKRYVRFPQFVLKSVDTVGSSATLICQFTLYASERAVSGYWYLTGSRLGKRKYQHLSYVVNMLIPVRYTFD
jgi:hypothetical protein